jgi:putative endonuclease
MIFVYAISSLTKNFIYIGQTNDVIRRFHEHNNGLENIIKPYSPFMLIYTLECFDRNDAREMGNFNLTVVK